MATLNLPFERVKKHSFNKKPYKLIWQKPKNNEGLCYPPSNKPEERKIYVNPNATAREFMYCLLHEASHAEQWYLDEDTVERISENLRDLLWRCGFRLVNNNGEVVEVVKKPRKRKKINQ